MKDTNRGQAAKENTAPKPEVSLQKLTKKVDELQKMNDSKEGALRQAKSAHQQIKNQLQGEIEGLRTEAAEVKKWKSLVNQLVILFKGQDGCPGCRKRWNVHVTHGRGCSISVGCKCCAFKGFVNGKEN